MIDTKNAILVQKVKAAISDLVQNKVELLTTKNSEYLSDRLKYDYSVLAKVFSDVTGTTVEQYIISQKIAQIKELLVAGELTLAQIAFQMRYSSAGHLSNQFKKETGVTPSFYRKRGADKITV
ncbi:helix-turn-helix domain-containing protein [Rufibacter glacialis]|uniref:Helix-turn-helix domain-containing protein n=1 Tax=Rufibacter glacialis TaxID=1259555 RepID=A0A5M8Q4D7_9BACT|nr:AraC family transcriptional regulator [Rufibacter glacialis]KAA6430747.1 helix-turn-helix transcriptional regulator [Rufibacter glacialis]GGK86429.1 hypothetical protein GCM10011405_37690 [Rufibacter glacialis]